MKRPWSITELAQREPRRMRVRDGSEDESGVEADVEAGVEAPRRRDAAVIPVGAREIAQALREWTGATSVFIAGDTDVDVIVTPHSYLDWIGTQGDAALVFITDDGDVYGIYDPTHSGLAAIGRHYTRAYPYRARDAFFFVVHKGSIGIDLQTYGFSNPDSIQIEHKFDRENNWTPPGFNIRKERGSIHTHVAAEGPPLQRVGTLPVSRPPHVDLAGDA